MALVAPQTGARAANGAAAGQGEGRQMQVTAPLNVLGLVGDALRDVFGHLGGLVRIAWAYYALAAVFTVLGMVLTTGSPLEDTIIGIDGGGTAQLILSTAVLACVVRWQRHIVLGEPLRGTAPLNWPVLRYSLWSLALGFVCLLPPLAAGLLAYATDAISSNEAGTTPFSINLVGIALLGVGAFLALLLFVRLNLVLPATSVGDRAMGLRQSWAATRGQGLRIFAVFLLLLLGLGLVGALAGLASAVIDAAAGSGVEAGTSAASASLIADAALNTGLDLIVAMVGASVTARLYQQLVAALIGAKITLAV
jgi:hypothetical protein